MKATLQAILAAAASFFAVALLFVFIFSACRGIRSLRRRTKTRNDPEAAHPPRSRNRASATAAIKDFRTESASFDPSLERISMSELIRSTKNFSSDLVIGDGSFGLVYRAELSSGVTVAVKRLDPDAFQGFREFRAEMETLGGIRHGNIVRILGFCAAGMDRILIYEFIENGSLDQWLYDAGAASSMSSRTPLPWPTRVNVVRGVARGLIHLHGSDPAVIHRDIKSSNVLLDSKFEAHIADFGLARCVERSHSHVSTQVAGTMGYMPPEYVQGTTMATAMGDVYSFGVLMMEVATAQRPNWPIVVGEEEEKKKKKEEVRLIEWVRKMMEERRSVEMVDSRLTRSNLKSDEVSEFFRIACLCTDETCRYRPSMKEVLGLLDKMMNCV